MALEARNLLRLSDWRAHLVGNHALTQMAWPANQLVKALPWPLASGMAGFFTSLRVSYHLIGQPLFSLTVPFPLLLLCETFKNVASLSMSSSPGLFRYYPGPHLAWVSRT